MKYLLIVLLLIPSLQPRHLPDESDTYVYLVSGEAYIAMPGKAQIAVKQGQRIYRNSILTLKKGAKITLSNANRNYLILDSEGTYKETDLKMNAAPAEDSLFSKLLGFFFEDLLKPNEDFETFKKENVTGVVGGVHRGYRCCNRVFPLDGMKLSAGSIVFRWYKTSPSCRYSFFIYDGNGEKIVAKVVRDTMTRISLNEPLHGQAGKYYWKVMSKDGSGEDNVPYHFDLLAPETERKSAEQLTVGMASRNIEQQLEKIDALQKNGFINAAFAAYADLVKADPGNNSLRKSYVSFLLAYGFGKEAEQAWKQ